MAQHTPGSLHQRLAKQCRHRPRSGADVDPRLWDGYAPASTKGSVPPPSDCFSSQPGHVGSLRAELGLGAYPGAVGAAGWWLGAPGAAHGAAESTQCLVPAQEGGPEGWALPAQAGRTRPRRANPRTCPCIEVSQPMGGSGSSSGAPWHRRAQPAAMDAHPCPWVGECLWQSHSPQHSHPGQQRPSLPALWGTAPHGDRAVATSSSFPWAGTIQGPLCSPGQHYRAPGTETQRIRSGAGAAQGTRHRAQG